MPIFDFKCNECENEFEKLVRAADIPPECPACGSKDTEKKQIQLSNFVLTGKGIYKNGT